MASTTKCFICKTSGNFDLTVCNDGKRHRVCDDCKTLCVENYIVVLNNGVAETIAEKLTWMNILITDIADSNKVRYDVDLSVPTTELEKGIQRFIQNTLTRYFDKDHNSPDVRIEVRTYQNPRFMCPVYTFDHMDTINGYNWYAEQYVKKYFVDGPLAAIDSPSMKFGKVPMNEHGLGFQAENMLKNTKNMPYVWYYVKAFYLPKFVHCYNLAVENYRIYGTPEKAVSFSVSTPPMAVKTEQGKEKVKNAQPGYVVTFMSGSYSKKAMFAENMDVQGGIYVWNDGKKLGVKYHNVIDCQPLEDVTIYSSLHDFIEPGNGIVTPLTASQKYEQKKALAQSAIAGDVVTFWYGGVQVKGSFVSCHDRYITVSMSYGVDTTVFNSIVSIEPGNNTPDDTAEQTEQEVSLPVPSTEQTPDSTPLDHSTPEIAAMLEDKGHLNYFTYLAYTTDDKQTEQTADKMIDAYTMRMKIVHGLDTVFNPRNNHMEIVTPSQHLAKLDALTSIEKWVMQAEHTMVKCHFCSVEASQLSMDVIADSYGVPHIFCEGCLLTHLYAGYFVYPEHSHLTSSQLPVQKAEQEPLPVPSTEQTPASKYTPDMQSTLFNPAIMQASHMEHNPFEVETPIQERLLSLPGYPAESDDDITVTRFKSAKSQKVADKIKKNALKHTSRFLALLVVGILACSILGLLGTGTSHAQTNTSNTTCKAHKYAHKAGYYVRGKRTTTYYAVPPSGCIVYSGESDNSSTVVSTSTPASTSTPTSTPVPTTTPTTSTHPHKKHTVKKHHVASQQTPACKYTFSDSDTGTHKRVCAGVSIVIKIDD